ncbi:MAG: glycosyltransferase, partial [Candidatus Hydrogenedentes bacterium]|nr:glycosyltransferase [Candidatus Hydrogenedentota bacterium]
GSTDDTARIAAEHGCQVIHSPAGRGVQQNAGAAAARGDVLLMLHADNWLAPDALQQVTRAMQDPNVLAGAFRQQIESPRDENPDGRRHGQQRARVDRPVDEGPEQKDSRNPHQQEHAFLVSFYPGVRERHCEQMKPCRQKEGKLEQVAPPELRALVHEIGGGQAAVGDQQQGNDREHRAERNDTPP